MSPTRCWTSCLKRQRRLDLTVACAITLRLAKLADVVQLLNNSDLCAIFTCRTEHRELIRASALVLMLMMQLGREMVNSWTHTVSWTYSYGQTNLRCFEAC